MDRTLLVTGRASFIGSAVAECRVADVDRLARGGRPGLPAPVPGGPRRAFQRFLAGRWRLWPRPRFERKLWVHEGFVRTCRLDADDAGQRSAVRS